MNLNLFKVNPVRFRLKSVISVKLKDLKITYLRLFLLYLGTLLLSACGSVQYYSQSVIGHSQLMMARKPVDKLIETSATELREKLELSKTLKQFAIEELLLPDTKSYDSYVELDREYPVWVVVAAPEFSLKAKQWCYPVIGCASYRGYFKSGAAHKYADSLQIKGFETVVSGASAYSTLGWFSDPLLPSMMRHGDAQFAETLFHEMAHQRLYIKGDSEFNEAFASLIAEIGVERWLERALPVENPERLIAYRRSVAIQAEFYQLLNQAKEELHLLYQSDQSVESKRRLKHGIFDQLKADHVKLVNLRWNGKAWYQSWFEPSINNAKFVSISTYRARVEELRQLLNECENQLLRFYKVLSIAKAVNGSVELPSDCR